MTFWQGKSSWFVITSFLSTPSPLSCCTGYKLLFCTALGAPSQHLLHQPRRGSAPLPTPYFCAWYLENVYFFQLIIWHLKKYMLKGPVREGHNCLEISSFLQKQNEIMILNITKSLECRETLGFLEFGVFYSWHLAFVCCIELYYFWRHCEVILFLFQACFGFSTEK